jgi:hypothetical protein
LTFSEAKKMPISEISLRKSLDGLGFSMDEVRLSDLFVLFRRNGQLPLLTNSFNFQYHIVHRLVYSSWMRLLRLDQEHRANSCYRLDQGAQEH